MRVAHADPVNEEPIEIPSRGVELLAQPLLNKDTAFSEAERDLFGLRGSCLRGCSPLRNRCDSSWSMSAARATIWKSNWTCRLAGS